MFDAPQDLLDGPALKAPPGVTVQLSRTSREQKWYFICVPLFTLIPGIFVLLRLYTKIKNVRIDLMHRIDFVVSAFVRLMCGSAHPFAI
jgi:bacteriorhodopsin